jgi:hypothetical protein
VRAQAGLNRAKIFAKRPDFPHYPALYENAVEFHQPLLKPALVAYSGTSYQISQSPWPAVRSRSFIGAA